MSKLNLSGLSLTVVLLLILGAVNWGLIGIFGFNLIAVVFAHVPVLGKVLYILIGISGICALYHFCKSK
jgi:uncharacterized protein